MNTVTETLAITAMLNTCDAEGEIISQQDITLTGDSMEEITDEVESRFGARDAEYLSARDRLTNAYHFYPEFPAFDIYIYPEG